MNTYDFTVKTQNSNGVSLKKTAWQYLRQKTDLMYRPTGACSAR